MASAWTWSELGADASAVGVALPCTSPAGVARRRVEVRRRGAGATVSLVLPSSALVVVASLSGAMGAGASDSAGAVAAGVPASGAPGASETGSPVSVGGAAGAARRRRVVVPDGVVAAIVSAASPAPAVSWLFAVSGVAALAVPWTVAASPGAALARS
jgi:hypothetical protein